MLPWEDAAEWDELLNGLIAEHQPSTPTEEFLVTEMARAQWKLNRVAHIEQELLTGEHGASDWSELADKWSSDCTYSQKLQKLERYETSLRRAWYNALNTLTKLRGPAQRAPKPIAVPETTENYKAKPIEASEVEPLAHQNTPNIECGDVLPEAAPVVTSPGFSDDEKNRLLNVRGSVNAASNRAATARERGLPQAPE